MRTALLCLAAAPFVLTALPAHAQQATATSAIVSGEYDRAERSLVSELRVHPSRPELMLNLAAVYAKTGREAQARALYQRVLGEEDVLMDLAVQQTAGSHAIALTGLRRLERLQVTAR